MQKTVTEVLLMWYFPYSAFCLAGQWGPPGYATGYCWYTFFAHGVVLTYKEMHSFSKSKNKLPQRTNRKHCYITP